MSITRWGIAATGSIARSMVHALRTIDDADIVAVGSRTAESAEAFATDHDIPRAHGSHTELVADPDVDVVYVASPHSAHRDMTIEALEAGKHVLCEKAFAVNHSQATEMIDTARRCDRFLMEAMWSWFMPAWHDIRRRIEAGEIGEVIALDANFCIEVADQDGRHHRADLTGGALLDLGIYPLALARFLLGEPDDLDADVQAVATLNHHGVDRRLAAVVRHTGGAVSTFTTSLDGTSDLTARVTGTAGQIHIDAPFWFPSGYSVTPVTDRAPAEATRIESPNRGLAHEAEHVMWCLAEGRIESDIQTWDATLDNMALMDAIRAQVGVVYPEER